MADHADPRRVDLRTRLQVIESTPRVPDVLALQGLAFRDAMQGLEALVLPVLELALGVLPLAEAERVGHDGDVAAAGQLDRVVLIGCGAEPRRTVLAHLELAAMLVVAEHGGERALAFRNEHEGGHALAGLDGVGHLLAHHVAEVDLLQALGGQRRRRGRSVAEHPQEARAIEVGSG